MTVPSRPTGLGMRRRLLVAQTLVLLAGGATTKWLPPSSARHLFRDHLHRAGVADDSSEQFRAEQAYEHATALSIAVAITVAALTAFVVTAYLSPAPSALDQRGVGRSVGCCRRAHDIRVAPPQLGDAGTTWQPRFQPDGRAPAGRGVHPPTAVRRSAHGIRTPVSVLEACRKPSRTT